MKKNYLKICNKCLLFISPVVLASGILQECLHGKPFHGIENSFWTWLHIIVSSVMTALVVWHVQLNWRGVSNWYRRFKTHRSPGLKFTVFFYFLTIVIGIIAVPHWISCGHGGIGGLHGKIGFASAFCIFLHTMRHRKWYSNPKSKHKTLHA